MKKSLVLSCIAAAALFTGCAATQSASIGGEYAPPAGKKVSASSSHMNFLLLSPTSAEQVDGVMADLAKQCGGKKVTGITTHYAPRGLLIVSIENISATGYCAD